MQLYSFNNLNAYKASISKIANGMNDYKNKFFRDVSQIKEYLNRTLINTPLERVNLKENDFTETLLEKKENRNENVFSEALINKKEKIFGKNGRFVEKSSKINLKKNTHKDSKNNNKKGSDYFDP